MKKNLDGGDNLRGGETILTQVDQRVQHPEHDRDDPDLYIIGAVCHEK